uniref:Uncharacterized protein n=1 Tax=Helianthus annuus TaxID=4232 RepID=A0A251UNP3_HELAN
MTEAFPFNSPFETEIFPACTSETPFPLVLGEVKEVPKSCEISYRDDGLFF